MKIVSERSAEELEAEKKASAQRWATADFDSALVSLTVNLLRVTRGAGKAYEVGRQAVELVQVMQKYRDAFGHYPGEGDFHRALTFERERTDEYGSREHRADALEQIMRGSLQVVASRLAGQRMQISAGEDEMWHGLKYYEEWQEERRRENAEMARAARAAAKSAKPRPIRPAKPK